MSKEFWLECPECGDALFGREKNLFSDGEEERCECGALCMTSIDDSDPDPDEAEVYVNVVEETTGQET